MAISLKESAACAEMARLLYSFLPGSGAGFWKGHVSFSTVANQLELGDFWQGGSKEPAIARLLELTLEHRRGMFERLVTSIVKEGLKYRQRDGEPVQRTEIEDLNGIILRVGFKFPDLWDTHFLQSLHEPRLNEAAVEHNEAVHETTNHTDTEPGLKLLQDLESRFYSLCSLGNRQQAGLELEKLLNELFRLSGLEPRSPFRVTGEQIDGSFCLDNEIYLLEAKWHKDPCNEKELLAFRGKISGKSQFTRGVFLSIQGISKEAQQAITSGKQPNFFCMDGWDLTIVLQGRIRLDALLRMKMRQLCEEGRVMISAEEILERNTKF
jgi:hypothetical protein